MRRFVFVSFVTLFLLVLAILSVESSTSTYTPSGSSYEHSYTANANTNASYKTNNSYSKPAMAKEQAEALKGTGYKGTRPNSTAESHELKCAQIKCDVCGMHTDNGYNSACDACRAKGYH